MVPDRRPPGGDDHPLPARISYALDYAVTVVAPECSADLYSEVVLQPRCVYSSHLPHVFTRDSVGDAASAHDQPTRRSSSLSCSDPVAHARWFAIATCNRSRSRRLARGRRPRYWANGSRADGCTPAPARPTRSSAASCSTSAGVTGRGFALAPGRSATASATSAGASSGMPRSRRRSKPPRRASSSTRAGRVVASDRGAEARDRLAGDRLVEAKRGRQRERVQRPVRDPVAAAEPLCERVPEREHRAAQRGTGVARSS